jgi:hypothetical protein
MPEPEVMHTSEVARALLLSERAVRNLDDKLKLAVRDCRGVRVFWRPVVEALAGQRAAARASRIAP